MAFHGASWPLPSSIAAKMAKLWLASAPAEEAAADEAPAEEAPAEEAGDDSKD